FTPPSTSLTTLSLNSFPYAFRIFVIIGLPYHNLDLIYWPEFWGVVQYLEANTVKIEAYLQNAFYQQMARELMNNGYRGHS
ncbi:MAG: hypothetical protein ACK53X_07430, partial [Holosporales bacterium]